MLKLSCGVSRCLEYNENYQEQRALYNMAVTCHSPSVPTNSAAITLALLFYKHAKLLPASEAFPYCSLFLEHSISKSPHDLFLYIIQATLTIRKPYFSPHIISHPYALISLIVFVITRHHLVYLFSPYFLSFFLM